MAELRAVIFDFNGVIVDDEPLHLELFKTVMAELGIVLSNEEYREKYLGFDDRGCFTAALADAGRVAEAENAALIAALIERKAGLYVAAINQSCPLFPGAVPLVKSLAETLPLAIASGALRNEIEIVLGRAGVRDLFQAIIAAEDVSACKPDPEGYVKALAALNALGQEAIRPEQCLVIEDSVAGIEAAKRAGMRCLAVTNSYAAEELWRADRVVATVEGCVPEEWFTTL